MSSCLLIAGEKSGEEHALSFFSEIKKLNPNTNFFGVGGDELASEGLELLYHLNDFSSWGYSEVIQKIPFYKKALSDIEIEVSKRNCQVAILIDFQSFNLKLAKRLKKKGVNILYYVAPQAWAWKEYRVKKLADAVHTLFTIIPFERKWFLERGVPRVVSVEHPQLTHHRGDLLNFSRHPHFASALKILLLPGSRNFEVESLLFDFIEATEKLKKDLPGINITVALVRSSSVDQKLYENTSALIFENTELNKALMWADVAIASSGTVTLSCALFSLPTVVCYRGSFLNYFIYETFVSYNGPISLANIILEDSVFPELVQERVSAFNIAERIKFWYDNPEELSKLINRLSLTKELVKGEGYDIPKLVTSLLAE